MAASATFALKAGVWFRRGRRCMVSPDSLGTACPPSGRNSTYRPVQILEAGSYLREGRATATIQSIRVRGLINIPLIALVIAALLGSAIWRPGISFNVMGTDVALQNLLRDAALVAIAGLSLWLTPDEHRAANGFTWEPIKEVAKLFAGIFIAIIPALAMLGAGRGG